MDDMQLVRDLYPEPAPPAAGEIAQAKALLAEPPRRVPRQLRLGLGGVAVAGTAAAVAIALTAGNAPATRPAAAGPAAAGPGGDPAPMTPTQAILTAADRAAEQPAGQYWYTDQIESQSAIVTPPTGAYAITGAPGTEHFSWWGAKPGTGEAFWDRTLPARPASPADEAAWRKAGSPGTFRVWAGDHYDTVSATGTTWQSDHPDPAGGGEFAGGMSLADLRKLPTDPVKLREMFFSRAAMSSAGLPADAAPSAALGSVAYFLGAAPLPPRVRAGLIRAMALEPGVTGLGAVTDPLGRSGMALAAPDQASGAYRWREVVLFDTETGALLAHEQVLTKPGGEYARQRPGFVIYYTAIGSQGWTDAKPAGPPAAG